MSQIEFRIRKARLGKEPELYESKSGSVVKLSLAVNHYKKVEGEWEETGTTWIYATAFRETAEQIIDMELDTGDEVYLTGTIKESVYEDDEGETKYSKDWYIDEIFRRMPREYDEDEPPKKKSSKKKPLSKSRGTKTSKSTKSKGTGIRKKSSGSSRSSSKTPTKKRKIKFI